MVAFLRKAIKLVDCQIDFVEKQILANQNAVNCPYKHKISKLKWTGEIVDLVELGYALEAVGYINDGKATLTELFDVLGEIFDTEVKNFSRTFIDIKNRVKDDGTFLVEDLKRALPYHLKRFIVVNQSLLYMDWRYRKITPFSVTFLILGHSLFVVIH